MAEVTVSSKNKGYEQEIKVGKHTFNSDITEENGGADAAPGPHELLLGALGACTSITMQMFAKKREWDLKSVSVKLSEEKIDDPNKPGNKVTKIVRNIQVTGNLTQEQLDGLKVAADKCQIHKLLIGEKQITTDVKHAAGVSS